jgi:hypothetical protein
VFKCVCVCVCVCVCDWGRGVACDFDLNYVLYDMYRAALVSLGKDLCNLIERCNQAVSTVSYSGDPSFSSSPGHRLT